ncbi:MAG: hypothetical protein U0457_15240 [Candidatus Sericytochromatia bacterium]
MTNSTAGVRLGGSGYSYGDYQLPDAKKPAIYDDENNASRSSQQSQEIEKREKEIEIFLFTLKDPVKSIISKLMDVIAVHGNKPIEKIDIPMAETGPLGYTSMFAFQPVQTPRQPEGLLKTTFR